MKGIDVKYHFFRHWWVVAYSFLLSPAQKSSRTPWKFIKWNDHYYTVNHNSVYLITHWTLSWCPGYPKEVQTICAEVQHSAFLFSRLTGVQKAVVMHETLNSGLSGLFFFWSRGNLPYCSSWQALCLLSPAEGLISMLGLWAGGHQPLRLHCFILALLRGNCLLSFFLSLSIYFRVRHCFIWYLTERQDVWTLRLTICYCTSWPPL